MPRPKNFTPFAAWAQYLGKDKDHDFIEWKKRQAGDSTEPPKYEGSTQGKGAGRNKENHANNGRPSA
jgi:hypothetical protein